MAGHPPYVSITKTLIRINAAAVAEHLPEDVTPDTHVMELDLNDDSTRLEIGFVKKGERDEGVYAINTKESGYHTSSGVVRDVILNERGVGRYGCKWKVDRGRLVVDLTTEVMEPQKRFQWKPS